MLNPNNMTIDEIINYGVPYDCDFALPIYELDKLCKVVRGQALFFCPLYTPCRTNPCFTYTLHTCLTFPHNHRG